MDPALTWLGIFLCLTQSALFSGLNLACFAVSRQRLEIEVSQGNQNAVKLLALRKDANFLLTTILWGNVAVNALLALLSGSVLGGVAGLLFSTGVITVFAEIIPQAYFSRNAIKLAALLSPFIRFYQVVLYLVAKPSAKVLDLWLGAEGVHCLSEESIAASIKQSLESPDSGVDSFEGRGAVNFLNFNSRIVSGEGQALDPHSIISLPLVKGQLRFPTFSNSAWPGFVQQVKSSGKEWVILTDPGGKPHRAMNVNQFARQLWLEPEANFDLNQCCIDPIVTTDPKTTLEQVLFQANLQEAKSRGRGLILLWGEEKRIIAHLDLLQRLFQGVFDLAPGSNPGTNGRLLPDAGTDKQLPTFANRQLRPTQESHES